MIHHDRGIWVPPVANEEALIVGPFVMLRGVALTTLSESSDSCERSGGTLAARRASRGSWIEIECSLTLSESLDPCAGAGGTDVCTRSLPFSLSEGRCCTAPESPPPPMVLSSFASAIRLRKLRRLAEFTCKVFRGDVCDTVCPVSSSSSGTLRAAAAGLDVALCVVLRYRFMMDGIEPLFCVSSSLSLPKSSSLRFSAVIKLADSDASLRADIIGDPVVLVFDRLFRLPPSPGTVMVLPLLVRWTWPEDPVVVVPVLLPPAPPVATIFDDELERDGGP